MFFSPIHDKFDYCSIPKYNLTVLTCAGYCDF